MRDWPVGLSTGCFHRTKLLDCLVPIRDAGFGLLEVCCLPPHLDYHDTAAVEAAARRLAALNLEVYSVHAPFAEPIDITALDPDARRHASDEIERAAEAAARLGARYFVLHPGPERSGLPRGERLDRMDNAAAVLNGIAARCRAFGVGLVLENMLPHLFSGHVRELLWLLGALETVDVGVCLDTGHAFLSGDLHTVAHKLSGHLWMIHASDNHGRFDDHLPPGDGQVPWQALLRQLGGTGFHGSFVLEIAGGEDPAVVLAGAQRGRAFLRRQAYSLDRPQPGAAP
jgi:sugar phosphate isomerase/epimerase